MSKWIKKKIEARLTFNRDQLEKLESENYLRGLDVIGSSAFENIRSMERNELTIARLQKQNKWLMRVLIWL